MVLKNKLCGERNVVFVFFFEYVEIRFFGKNEFGVAYDSSRPARRKKHGFVGYLCGGGELRSWLV